MGAAARRLQPPLSACACSRPCPAGCCTCPPWQQCAAACLALAAVRHHCQVCEVVCLAEHAGQVPADAVGAVAVLRVPGLGGMQQFSAGGCLPAGVCAAGLPPPPPPPLPSAASPDAGRAQGLQFMGAAPPPCCCWGDTGSSGLCRPSSPSSSGRRCPAALPVPASRVVHLQPPAACPACCSCSASLAFGFAARRSGRADCAAAAARVCSLFSCAATCCSRHAARRFTSWL